MKVKESSEINDNERRALNALNHCITPFLLIEDNYRILIFLCRLKDSKKKKSLQMSRVMD